MTENKEVIEIDFDLNDLKNHLEESKKERSENLRMAAMEMAIRITTAENLISTTSVDEVIESAGKILSFLNA